MKPSKEVEVRGHLIDSFILSHIFDKVMDLKGDFEVLEFRIGKLKHEHSYARLVIRADDEVTLKKILQEVYRLGATPVEVASVKLERAPKDDSLPNDFYSTTNHPTYIYVEGRWVRVEDQMMDKAIVYYPETGRAVCKPIREVKKGELIVIGEEGVKVVPPERPRKGVGVFDFMVSKSSSEKPTSSITRQIAVDMYELKGKGGKIAVVVGPAVVHTGAAEYLAKIIRLGYVDALLAGNALAVHDVEYALYGTSLGMNIENGTLAYRGHRNHMAAVNEVFKHGGLREMVKSGRLTKGIMYECIVNEVPYALAGSIRDDGPLPDVITDVVEAQREYKRLLKKVDMVLMLATTLHSIAVGNMLPSYVKTVAVDINPAVITKLMDRGTAQAAGVVSDVGAFIPLLANELERLGIVASKNIRA